MKLISERVAKGQDVQALFGKKNGGKKKGAPGTSGASPSSPKAPERPWSPPRGQSKLKGIGKMIGNEGYKMAKEAVSGFHARWLQRRSLIMACQFPDEITFVGFTSSICGCDGYCRPRCRFQLALCALQHAAYDSGTLTWNSTHSIPWSTRVSPRRDHAHREASQFYIIRLTTIEGRYRRRVDHRCQEERLAERLASLVPRSRDERIHGREVPVDFREGRVVREACRIWKEEVAERLTTGSDWNSQAELRFSGTDEMRQLGVRVLLIASRHDTMYTDRLLS